MKNPVCYSVTCKKLLLSVFRSLSAVLGTGLASLSYAGGIKRTADDVVTGTGKVLYTTAADQYYAMLLKVMSFTRNIARYFKAIAETYSCNLTKCGVRLLRGRRTNCGTYASLLRSRCVRGLLSKRVKSLLKCRSRGLLSKGLTSFSYQLVKCRHSFTSY